jgi:AcrR family transcriptional regulator
LSFDKYADRMPDAAPVAPRALPRSPDHRESREHGDETRARIIDAALELIADHGFASTSTREISERLGFTKAALYYHFHTKDDLLAAIVEPVMRDLAALVEGVPPDGPASERRRVLEGYVELVATHADLMKVLANDPAMKRCGVLDSARPLHEQLERVLAGASDLDVALRVRARAAIGAVLVPLMRTESPEQREVVRGVVLAAAAAVLGLPDGGEPESPDAAAGVERREATR